MSKNLYIKNLRTKVTSSTAIMPEWAYDFIDFSEVTDVLLDYCFYAASDLGDDVYGFLNDHKDDVLDIIKNELDREVVFLWMASDTGKGALIGNILQRIFMQKAIKELDKADYPGEHE